MGIKQVRNKVTLLARVIFHLGASTAQVSFYFSSSFFFSNFLSLSLISRKRSSTL